MISSQPGIISAIRAKEKQKPEGRHGWPQLCTGSKPQRAATRPWRSPSTLATGQTNVNIKYKHRMAWISDSEDENPNQQASSPKVTIVNGASCLQNGGESDSLSVRLADNKNPLADFPFDKLPTELLVKIFQHARADTLWDAYKEEYPYPIALAQVCCLWRSVALSAPTLWTNIYILKYYTERTEEFVRIYLERSKTCPIFLTWFSKPELSHSDAQGVINDLIIPEAERWQRITLIAGNDAVPDALLTAMGPLDFPILQDVEISCLMKDLSPSKPGLCRSAPLLRRCRLRGVPSLPPLSSGLVVLDCVFSASGITEFDLDPLLEFLPHVSHSLEHLRFGPPPVSKVQSRPRTSKIPLENLRSLLIKDSHTIMNHIFAPNLTYFVALHPHEVDARGAAKMFEGFSAPMLKSIQFHEIALQPVLTGHRLPSMFPQLESVVLSGCTDELAFADLLGPPNPKEPLSLKKASKYPPKHQKVENPFPNLKEFTISDMKIWPSLQASIERRLKNGDKSIRKIQLPNGEATEAIMPHLRRWLPANGIELVVYDYGELPTSTLEFQDDPCDRETSLFFEIMQGSEWDEDDDYEYWEERELFHPDFELPAHLDPHQYWDEFYDGYDDEEEEEEGEEEDFYEG